MRINNVNQALLQLKVNSYQAERMRSLVVSKTPGKMPSKPAKKR